ncbi:MAG: flagellar FliJ family protein [Miltoncostaeaceae bacterium]
MSARFHFRLEKVLDHRARQEELVRQELAGAIAAVAAQQEKAIEAEGRVEQELAVLRCAIGRTTTLAELRAKHDDLALARGRARHEAQVVDQLEAVADERRAELVRASQDREALSKLRTSAHERHTAEMARVEANALDDLALRRTRRGMGGRAA